MKCLFVIFFYLFQTICNNLSGQDLVLIRDTINNFVVGVPEGWVYGVPKDKSIAFVAFRPKQSELDIPRENININIFNDIEIDTEKSFNKFLKVICRANEFKLLDQGEKIINNRKFNYLVETHKNTLSQDDMTNYVFFSNNNGKILVLTMVTFTVNFDKYKDLFDAISLSLKI